MWNKVGWNISGRNRHFLLKEIGQDSNFIIPTNFCYYELFLNYIAFWSLACYTVIHNSITVKTHGGCSNETDYFKCIWRPHIRAD